MIRHTALTVALIGLVTAGAWAQASPVDLLVALEHGQVDAVFYGNGDESVRGRIRRTPFGPQQLYVAPGTQFWAQQPGLQGMTTLGWVPIELSRSITYVQIPTACTNFNLPAPTSHHRMIPTPCPDVRMAALSDYIGYARPPREAVQIAVWAVANDPQWDEVAGYVGTRATGVAPEELPALAERYRLAAADLLSAVGLRPAQFRMFAGMQ